MIINPQSPLPHAHTLVINNSSFRRVHWSATSRGAGGGGLTSVEGEMHLFYYGTQLHITLHGSVTAITTNAIVDFNLIVIIIVQYNCTCMINNLHINNALLRIPGTITNLL